MQFVAVSLGAKNSGAWDLLSAKQKKLDGMATTAVLKVFRDKRCLHEGSNFILPYVPSGLAYTKQGPLFLRLVRLGKYPVPRT